ncbi:hypothetical protein CA13_10530 [Planctomycetes bacterium CA13]|uniref:Uncharacterized protein n=1 Tax=Novipirellula herctigrandis TaxID=2527986 RepID=A0A5C5YX67_9BACT|nr:hypothetical protein CA13_10530 [Planctomycetes bacterium CA13]
MNKIRNVLFTVAIIGVVALLIATIILIRRMDDPVASVIVAADVGSSISDEEAIAISEKALRLIEFEPVRLVLAFGSDDEMRAVGRNVYDQNNVTVIWQVHGQRYTNYTVRMRPTNDGITASVYANWL